MNKNIKDLSKFRSSVRIGMHEYFLEMALASFESYQKIFENLEKYKVEGGFVYGDEPELHYSYHKHDEIFYCEQQIVLEIIKSIVFLNMYCEAYIWDLAASILGDKYAKKYLNRFDTLSKWIIIPKILFGKEIDEGHHSLGVLKELIRLRNDFVHSKSKDGSAIFRNPNNYAKELVPLEEQIHLKDIFCGIRDLFLELNKIDLSNSHYLSFERGIQDNPLSN